MSTFSFTNDINVENSVQYKKFKENYDRPIFVFEKIYESLNKKQ